MIGSAALRGVEGTAVLDAVTMGDYIILISEFIDLKGDVTNDGVSPDSTFDTDE